MINFTDKRLYAKGTCNVILEDPATQDIWYQSNKLATGNITMSTNLNEIRAGLGNPIVAMIPSDSQMQVDFDAADFSLQLKAAQFGGTVAYGAPVWTCQTVTAAGETLSIDTSAGVPVAQLGHSDIICHVQEVGADSRVITDGAAYPISETGVISEFTAVAGTQYKVWYFVQKTSAQVAPITSLIDPKVARAYFQIAVFANAGSAQNQGTRVGWLYVTIPYLKLDGQGGVTADQTNADTSKISGQAIAYDETVVSATCSDCDTSILAYYTYVPDEAVGTVQGLVVVGGVTQLEVGASAQLPVRFVMVDGSIVTPADYSTGFTYTIEAGSATGTTISPTGVITAGDTAGDAEVTVTYTEGTETYTCVSNVSVVSA